MVGRLAIIVALNAAIAVALNLAVGVVHAPAAEAASKEEEALFSGCDWLERAIAREPERDDAFGMFMRGMRPKCRAMLEGIARKDNSVRSDAVRQIVKEIGELQEVIDAEHGGPPPAAPGPTPAELAQKKVADEKAAAERAAEDKAAAERAAAEDKAAAERAAAERAAQDKAERERAEAERIAAERAAEEAKKAEEEAQRQAEREERERAAADDKASAAEKRAAEREAKARAAAEKKAAEEAKKAAEREARERAAAEKKAAEEAKKAAEREERERAAAEKKAAEEARRLAEEERLAAEREAKARAEAEREARRKAEALVAAEDEAERRAAAERDAKKTPAPKPKRLQDKGIDGTWEQPEAKVLDRMVKRTLDLMTKGNTVQGELFEEVWFPAPSSWIDTSCGGNDTFRMVTTARVSGEIDGKNVVLSREPPRILTCTCSSRCTVETRRRGFDLRIAASGFELKDSTGVFVRPGTMVVAPASSEDKAPGKTIAPSDFAGHWETAPFKQRDRTVVQRLELEVDRDGKVRGTFIERTTQGLPLASWSERFCDGADRWEWVTQWKLEGRVSGRKATLEGDDGDNILCTCPSKCTRPKDKLGFDLVYGVTGVTLHLGDRSFERR